MTEPVLLLTLSVTLVVALIFGFATQRLGLSPIVGYLLAGIVIGPHTPGFVADQAVAQQFAEVGVILLMFGVGLHFQLKDLVAVQRIVLPGAIGQGTLAVALGTGLALVAGWGLGAGLVFGLGIAIASTVVLIRVLADNDRLETPEGRVVVGWLVVQDIFTVLVLVLLPPLAHALQGTGTVSTAITDGGLAVLKLAILAVLMIPVGSRVIPWFLLQVARVRSRELFTLAVLALALTIATGSAHLFGASIALGAFLAGMAVGQSEVSHQAAADALPMRDAFAVIFFVSVGMLFDVRFVLDRPDLVLAALSIVLVATPLVALLIVALLGYSARTGLTVAVGLMQIGEFSFIVAAVARQAGVLPPEAENLLVAVAMLSITLNPVIFRRLTGIESWLRRRPRLWRLLNRRAEARGRALNAATRDAVAAAAEAVHAVVVGYGPVGRTVSRILRDFGIRPVVVDLNVDTAARLSAEGELAVYGDAAQREILLAAGAERARFLIVTLPDMKSRAPVLVAARSLSPDLTILVRARYLAERTTLDQMGASAVCYEEAEAAVALADLLLRQVGADEQRLLSEAEKIRGELAVRRPDSRTL